MRFSSAVAVLLAVVFVGICSVMAISALIEGKTKTPKLVPHLDNHTSFFDLVTVVPVIVTAFTFHYNGMIQSRQPNMHVVHILYNLPMVTQLNVVSICSSSDWF